MAATRTAKKTATAKKVAAAPRKRTIKVPKDAAPDLNHAYIPDPSVAAKYVGRKVWGIWDIVLFQTAMRNGENILLMGDTGAGKTLVGEAFASRGRMRYYSLPCDISIDPTSLFGRMQPTDTPGQYRWQDGPVTSIVRGPCGLADKCEDPTCFAGVLNVSEVNFMTPKIAASLYPLFDGRRYIPLLGHEGEVVRAHHNLLIIADMNPNYRGTMELNDAFRNRFRYKIPWGYDTEVEEKLIEFPTMRGIASDLREMTTDIVTPISTNMLMEFEQIALDGDLGMEFAIQNFASAFRKDESEAVVKIMELNKVKVEKDMKFIIAERRRKARHADVDEDDFEEIEWEQEAED